MATTASPMLDTGSSTSFKKIWQGLTQPSDLVQGESRRKATTLSALLLVFMPLAVIVILVSPITNILSGKPMSLSAPGVIAVVFVFVAYRFSRTKYHEIAAYVTVGIPIFAVAAIILTSTTPTTAISLFYLTLSVVLSGLLLDGRGTIITGVGAIAFFCCSSACGSLIASPPYFSIPQPWSSPRTRGRPAGGPSRAGTSTWAR